MSTVMSTITTTIVTMSTIESGRVLSPSSDHGHEIGAAEESQRKHDDDWGQ